MRKLSLFYFVMGAAAAALSMTMYGNAAPLRLKQAELPESVRSLAALDRVRLRVEVAALLSDIGLTRDYIVNELTNRLTDAGIEVVDNDKEVPELLFQGRALMEPKVENGLAYAYLIALRQHSHVMRLDRGLTVPTFVHPVMGLEPMDAATAQSKKNAVRLIEGFIYEVQRATENQ